MTNFLIRIIGLKKRIYSGYIVAGAVALIIALLSYGVFIRLSNDFQAIILFSRQATENITLVTQMSEMQRQALIYISAGHHAAAERVGVIYNDMIARIEQIQGGGQLDVDAHVELTKKHLRSYHEAFLEVRTQREIQQQLVREEFRKHASEAQRLIERQLTAIEGDDTEQTLNYLRMLNFLLQIEKNAYRYFDSLDLVFVNAASESIRATGSVLDSLSSPAAPEQERLAEIKAVLEHYEISFLEAVQRTRGYLYLVNVVMSAQAYETIYQSKRLGALMLRESERIQEEVLQDIGSTLNFLVFSIIFLLLFISFFSYVISQSITVPLKRLTRTFRTLTAGSLDAAIPEYKLKDELGELTVAAESFKQKNRELEENRKELKRSNDELEQFVYTVSHDLKSPIVTSMGFIGIIRKLAQQGKYEQAIDKLDKVVKANERMSQLIRDLLELSRVGRMDMDKKQLDLNELLVSFAGGQNERLQAKGFKLVVESGLPVIYGNESRILQVFENILSNALKYAHNEDGGELVIHAIEDDHEYHIFCRDNGPGIPTEYHKKIFGLFYRLNANTEGTGIGLAVAKKIMKFHGGDIQVEPQSDGEGAVFRLIFPKQAT